MATILFGTLLLFPLVAVWVRRRRGIGALSLLTAVTAAITVALVFWMASKLGGNRLVGTQGYPFTLRATLHLVVTTTLLPVLAAAGAAATTKVAVHPGIAYGLAVLVTLITAVAGIILAVHTLS